jgi:hypothetical protein
LCAILENRCVELAAGVQVYSDPASTLRMMAHNHSASQDVVLAAIQQTSEKPQSPTLMDLDIQDRGDQLRRIPLPRTSVNTYSVALTNTAMPRRSHTASRAGSPTSHTTTGST